MTSNNDGQHSATASSSISKTAQQATRQAGDMLNILGDKAEALKGQNETVDKGILLFVPTRERIHVLIL
jgi:hypothetical protein